MNLENKVEQMNITTFLREFTIVDLKDKFETEQEIELCDGLVILDSILIAFQIKERTKSTGDFEAEQKWFNNKVKKKAMRQMRDTIGSLAAYGGTHLANAKGRKVPLPDDITALNPHYVVVFKNALIAGKTERHYVSKTTSAFVHIFESSEWKSMMESLVTPVEIEEYLIYRERVLLRAPNLSALSEEALMGGFFGNEETFPREHSRHRHARVIEAAGDLDLSIILETMEDRIYEHDEALLAGTSGSITQASNDYYPLIAELAKMHRTELRSFQKFWAETWSSLGEAMPRRLHFPPSPRSFVFMTPKPGLNKHRLTFLNNITYAAKYTTRTEKCIGICFSDEGDGVVLVDWMMISQPWEPDPGFDLIMESSNPFPTSRAVAFRRYPES